MIDQSTLEGRIVAAALRLAAERPWHTVTLMDIAGAGGTNLAELRGKFCSKGAILAAFLRMTDDEVLRRAQRRSDGQSAKDALFEVVMSRFDALAPHKAALRSVTASPVPDPLLLRAMLSSQAWMLQAAGISSEGPRGAIRTAGLASLYASVFQTWLDDDGPDLAKTMAALDRKLRRAERSSQSLDEMASGVCRLVSVLTGSARERPGKAEETKPSTA